MDEINTIADPSTFGLQFNYSLWTPGTQIRLANVPWDSAYRDVVRFASNAALNTYLASGQGPTESIAQMTLLSPGVPVRINVPFSAAQQYNYLHVSNHVSAPIGVSPDTDFYYFILDVRYVAPNTTQLVLQLDIWQTWGRKVEFGRAFVERGHIGIANENAMRNNGRDFLTVPEGLDLGSDYIVVENHYAEIATAETVDILVASTVDFSVDDFGTMENPTLSTATGGYVENLPNAHQLIWFTSVDEFLTFLSAFSNKPWMTQGIVSIMAIPPLTGMVTPFNYTVKNGLKFLNRVSDNDLRQQHTIIDHPWFEDFTLGRYQGLSKFFTYPYSFIELTIYSGAPLVLKPELLAQGPLTVTALSHIVQPNPRYVIYPEFYNAAYSLGPTGTLTNPYTGKTINDPDHGEFLDFTTGIFNLPTFALVNNGYISTMAAQAHRIHYANQSAEWSQQKTLYSAGQSAAQATAAMDLSTNLANIEQQQIARTAQQQLGNMQAHAAASAVMGPIGGVVQGAVGGPFGAAQGAGMALGAAQNLVNTAIDAANVRNVATIQQSGVSQRNTASVANAAYLRDSNYLLTEFAAKGDYANEIAGINARVQDAKLTQPTTSGQVGGDGFLLGMWRWAIVAKVKMVAPATLATVGEFWLRYGYAVNRFMQLPPTLSVMSKFTYWKVREAYVKPCAIPEAYKQAMRGILEKGVTVWVNADDIGVTDTATNAPLEGISL